LPSSVTDAKTRKLAEIAIDPRFERIAVSLGSYGEHVRVGTWGPTVEELYKATH
jgi:hypothetical protein